MLGLGFGRLLCNFTGGIPTFEYQFRMVAEIFIGFYGLWVLKNMR